MNEPTYHLSHVVKSKNSEPEDLKARWTSYCSCSARIDEIQDVSITAILDALRIWTR